MAEAIHVAKEISMDTNFIERRKSIERYSQDILEEMDSFCSNIIEEEVRPWILLMWPHEVEPWFHSWYRGRVETLHIWIALFELLV